MLIQHAPVRIRDFADEVRRVIAASIAKGGVCRRQLHGGHAVGHGAKGEGEIGVAVIQRNADHLQIFARSLHADLIQQRYSRHVQTGRQRRADADIAVIGVSGVARLVTVKVGGLVLEDAGGRITETVDGRGIHSQRLQSRTGLTPELRGPVEAAAQIVAPAAHNGQHLAGLRMDAGSGGLHLRAIGGVFGENVFGKLFLQHFLMFPAQCGINHEAAGEDGVAGQAEQLFGFVQHRIHKPSVRQHLRLLFNDGHGFG